MKQCGESVRNQSDLRLRDEGAQKVAIQGGGDGEQKFVLTVEQGRRFHDRGQVHAYFFDTAAGHESDPEFLWIKMELLSVVSASDRRVWQLCQRMAYEGGIHAAVAIELFFKRKDNQRFVDVVAKQADASLAPRPELWSDIINRRDAALFHLTGNAPVEGGRVDHDGEVGLAAVGFANQVVVEPENFREVAQDLSDADDREIFGVDHGVAAGSAHAVRADTEEGEVGG